MGRLTETARWKRCVPRARLPIYAQASSKKDDPNCCGRTLCTNVAWSDLGWLKVTLNNVMKVQLIKIAHARSGDKGDTANVGLIALKPEHYPILVREVTAERVKRHFAGICKGEVERYELPNLKALNFLLHHSLGGGGAVSLKADPQGKTLSSALLRMEIEVGEDEL